MPDQKKKKCYWTCRWVVSCRAQSHGCTCLMLGRPVPRWRRASPPGWPRAGAGRRRAVWGRARSVTRPGSGAAARRSPTSLPGGRGGGDQRDVRGGESIVLHQSRIISTILWSSLFTILDFRRQYDIFENIDFQWFSIPTNFDTSKHRNCIGRWEEMEGKVIKNRLLKTVSSFQYRYFFSANTTVKTWQS